MRFTDSLPLLLKQYAGTLMRGHCLRSPTVKGVVGTPLETPCGGGNYIPLQPPVTGRSLSTLCREGAKDSLHEVFIMCVKGVYEEEVLEFDKNILALFRQYQRDVICELSEKEFTELTQEAFISDFLTAIKDRLPDVLKKDKRGDYES